MSRPVSTESLGFFGSLWAVVKGHRAPDLREEPEFGRDPWTLAGYDERRRLTAEAFRGVFSAFPAAPQVHKASGKSKLSASLKGDCPLQGGQSKSRKRTPVGKQKERRSEHNE